ncbi:MAG: hypothetical protein GXO34_03765 [Deltaproteobacteria bacterium]|nr:hypothetical protein [Deltaproteobacteria bacterium]
MKRCYSARLVLATLIGAVLLLAGCVSQRESMIEQGYPPAYAAGFEDGYHSGKKAAGSYLDQFKKDVHRFQTDPQYAQGWNDGYRQGDEEQKALDRQIRNSTEQQRLYEEKKHNHRDRDLLKGIDTRGLENLK